MTNPLSKFDEYFAREEARSIELHRSDWSAIRGEIERLRADLEKAIDNHSKDLTPSEPGVRQAFADAYRQQSETKQGGVDAPNEQPQSKS